MSLLHAAQRPAATPLARTDRVVVPFSLSLVPIARIALLDFTGDSTYRGLEVQRIADPGGVGEGAVVLMARIDGTTDVYFEPHLQLDRHGYDWVSNGLAGWFPTSMAASQFEITPGGLQLDVRFVLGDGRPFDLRIHERRPAEGRGFTLLAPAGHGSANPTFLPVFWLSDVRFVRRRGSNIDIRIGGEIRSLARAPIPWKLARYCDAPVLGVWNEQQRGTPAVTVAAEAGEHHVPDGTVEIVDHHGGPALRSLTARCGQRLLAVVHDPPLPRLDAVNDGALLKGRVTVSVDDTELFGGGYRLRRAGDRVDLEVDVTRPWVPRDQSILGAVMFRVLVFFRTWPTTYRWRASVDLAPEEPVLASQWERKQR
jgi:hypothetical protein